VTAPDVAPASVTLETAAAPEVPVKRNDVAANQDDNSDIKVQEGSEE
jgi:hypothetical protein